MVSPLKNLAMIITGLSGGLAVGARVAAFYAVRGVIRDIAGFTDERII